MFKDTSTSKNFQTTLQPLFQQLLIVSHYKNHGFFKKNSNAVILFVLPQTIKDAKQKARKMTTHGHYFYCFILPSEIDGFEQKNRNFHFLK